MTVVPADAPRSEDGHWWWDGSQWQPVIARQVTNSMTHARIRT